MITRRYSELKQIDSFIERYRYLALNGEVGYSTFGFDRYLNQKFYTSWEWKQLRNHIIARDNSCDLGVEEYDIHGRILIHHMNPLTPDDIKHSTENLLNPDYLITTTRRTHNAIHYGDEKQLPTKLVERSRGDTKLW